MKLADLALAGGMPEPEFGNPGKDPVVAEKLVTVRRWVDGEGRGNELELRWFSKGDFNWSMQHVIGKSDGERVTLQADGYIHLQGGALFEFLHKGVGRKSGFWK